MRQAEDLIITQVDLLIVGAGPAGMAAAVEARKHGLDVLLVDEQPSPGGQIWRSVEAGEGRDDILGSAYFEGRDVSKAFRACGAGYLPNAQVWQVDRGFRVLLTSQGQPQILEAKTVLLASGAQERPVPFPGWTLPGVLTVGAAQILLKNAGQIPVEPVWIAGSGPLPLLYAVQLLRAGGRIAGYLDTAPAGNWRAGVVYLPGALRSARDLIKGLGWSAVLRKQVKMVRHVTSIEATGADHIESLRYKVRGGPDVVVPAQLLLVHEGVVPNIHPALSLGCAVSWNSAQHCFAPQVDGWGETSVENLFIAGDGAGIAGAKAAQLRGTLAAIRISTKVGRLDHSAANGLAGEVRTRLRKELAIRPFLDALFPPRAQIFQPADATIVCRCEEVTAGEIRSAAAVGCPGPNQIKAATRAGMGPCQGRQCGYTVTRILADVQGRAPAEVGFFNIRPPLKPVTLGELAALAGRSTGDNQGLFEDTIGSADPHVVE